VLGKNLVDQVAQQPLRQLHGTLEIEVSHLGLDHPKLGEMSPGFALFSPERRSKAIRFAEGHRRCFHVQLPGLGEVGLTEVEVGNLEQGAGAFACGRGEYRGVDERESVQIEVVADRFFQGVTHSQDDVLAHRAQPEMAVLHQVGDAVLLGSDRVILGFLDHLQILHRELETDGAALIGAHQTPNPQRSLLANVVRSFEDLG